MARTISVTGLGDFKDLEAAMVRAGMVAEDTGTKMGGSFREAGLAAAESASKIGKSLEDQEAAAGRAAAAFVEASSKISTAQRAAGDAAAAAAKQVGASVDEQRAAYGRAVAAQQAYEDSAAKAALASKALADAQTEAAAKVDLLGSKMSGLGEKTTGIFAEISKIGGIGFGASIAGMGDLAAKFQQSTEQIAANSQISSGAAAQIGKAFLTTSGSSIYSAKEMADAFAQVSGQLKSTEGRALDAAQSLKVMNAAGDLAEATSSTLADSTAALATVMQGYRLPVTQAAAASDVLFNTSRALNQPLDTIAQAINRLHGRLGDLAPSLGDVGGLMVELGSHGVQGSRGVSVVNTAMQTLIGGSTQTTQVLAELGVHVFDSQGKFVGLGNVISQLQPKFAQLSQQNQDLAAKTLFGSSAAQVMLSIVQRGPDAFNKSVSAAQKLGSAHKAAADQSKTLGKQLDILKASVEDAATSIGLKLLPVLTTMTKDLEAGVQWLEQHRTATEALAVAIGTGLGGAVTVFAYQKATSFLDSVGKMGSALATLGMRVKTAGASIGSSMGLAASETEAADTAIVESADTTAGAVDAAIGSTGIGLVIVGLGVAATEMATHWQGVMSIMKEAADGMETAVTASLHGVISVLNDAIGVFNASVGKVTGDIGKIGQVAPSNAGQYGPGPDALRHQLGIKNPGGAALVNFSSNAGYKTSEFPGTENTFIQALASKLGFSPAVIAGWANAEQPPGSPSNAANPYNFLNISESGSTYRGSRTNIWKNPLTAAAATAQWIKTGKGVPGWGASGVPAIVAAGGGTMAQQIKAIQGSGWVNGPHGGISYPNLPGDVQAVLGKSAGGATGGGLTSTSGINLAGLTQADSPVAKAGLSMLDTFEKALVNGSMSSLRALAVPAETQKYQQQVASLRGAGDDKLANALVAVHTKLMQALTASLLANMKSYEGQALANQATELQDQTQRVQDTGQAQLTVIKALQQRVNDAATNMVQHLKNVQQKTDDMASNVVQHMQNMTQTVVDQFAGIAQAMKDAAQVRSDQSQGIVDAINDQTQIQVDQIGEKGLYGLNLVAQKLQVQSDITKAYWDQQIDTAQQSLDVDQMMANMQENAAQVNVDMVTAQQKSLVALAQQHMDQVTINQDARMARAQAHMDAVTVRQDQLITKAQAHADAVQLHADTTLIGPAQIAVDMNANASKTVQATMQAQLSYYQGLGSKQENEALLGLANITSSANQAIQVATNSYNNVQNSANRILQEATDAYNAQQNAANKAIQVATSSLQILTAKWNETLAGMQSYLQKIQGQAGQAEAQAGSAVSREQALSATEFAGSGLTVNVYGAPGMDEGAVMSAASWAFRNSGLAY